MEKIKQYRPTQTITFDEFIEGITENGVCEYCSSYYDCLEAMGIDCLKSISGQGCNCFDNSIEKLKQFYIENKCTFLQD